MNIHKNHSSADAGFSLLELVVVVGVLTIVMGAAFTLMARSQESFDRNQTMAEAHQNADFAVVRVAEILRGAGSNPTGNSTVNSLPFVSNLEVGSTTVNTSVVRVRSDLDCNGATASRVSGFGDSYYIVTSEDVTIKFYATATTVGSTSVPANSLCIIDNTAGTDSGVPIVLASNITAFQCTVPTDKRKLEVSITGGPSKAMPTTDPRYVTFTRTKQIRMRNLS